MASHIGAIEPETTMENWVQVYNPLGSVWLSTVLAAAPIVVLLGLLLVGVSAHRSAFAGLATAVLSAIWGFGMPARAAVSSAAYGACFGLLPIGWIVFSAVFLFHLTLRTGQFDVIRWSVARLSADRRMQALLIAFSFGTFLEAAAGFGTPVAICAAMMIGLGFAPLQAAALALLANTAPVAFGALGTPIATLAKISGINEMAISQMAGRQLPLFSLLIPVWLVWMMAGWRGVKGSWPAILVSGGSYAALQFFISNFWGPSLVGVAGGLGSMICLAVFLRFWQPREIWRFGHEQATDAETDRGEYTARQVAYAWAPWVILSAMIFLWGWPTWKSFLAGERGQTASAWASVAKPTMRVPYLDKVVYRTSPVVQVPTGSDRAADAEKAVYEFAWLTATGTAIFLAAVATAFWLRIGPGVFVRQLGETLWKTRIALFTIACMLAVAFTTKYSGSDATLGLAFTKTGVFYPFFAPLLGWLGVALTGSDTSSNALFGSLQRITAEQLGLNPVLIVTSNSTGGVMGKMIDAQSIVVAAVATEQSGNEGQILRYIFPHSLALAILMGLLTVAQAYLWPGIIPAG